MKLDQGNSDAILIHVGINGVTVQRKTPTYTVDSIRFVGRKCKYAGINEVIVSSVVRRKTSRFQMKINEVNNVLKDLYVVNGFTFIDNVNINNSDICDNLLHLKYAGTCKLANNFIYVINKVLDKQNFRQSTVDSSKNGPESSVMNSLPDNNDNLLSKLRCKVKNKLIIAN